MKQHEADRLAGNLVTKFGLPVKATVNTRPEGQYVLLEPQGVHPNEGFQIIVRIGWRSLFIELTPGKFAGDLLKQMGRSSSEKKSIFSDVARQILYEKAVLNLRINETPADPLNPESWPPLWRSLFFSLRKTPLEINTDDHRLTEHLTNLWVERFFGCVIALSPLEEVEENTEISGLPEGAISRVTVNRYERNRYNRTICINFHGTVCKACQTDLGDVYGALGDGFIHIHHVTPVSRLGPNYIINPLSDLVPVCPNCHSMLHRRDPPLTVEELQRIMQQVRK